MQMLFIIPLLKTENPYYIIVNILTDNGENTMQNEKTSVLVLAQCDVTMRETLNTRFGTQCAFTFAENGEHPTAEQLRAAAVIFGEPSEAQLAQTENLRLLQLTWAGADKYTRMENLPQSVVLANASGAFGTIIAEYAIGSLVALYRSFGRYWSNKQAHIWQKYDHAETISGKTALVLGMGDIGANVARRLKVFGAAVLGVKRTAVSAVPADFDEAHTLDALDALLPRADIVIGCLPNTRETAGLLTAERLHAMKAGAVLVNVGRGSLAGTDDLVSALQDGHLGGAALDVFETEPLPADCPLWDMENVLLTPHIAGPSFGGSADVQNTIWHICMDNLERYLTGNPLKNVVNRSEGYLYAFPAGIATERKRAESHAVGSFFGAQQFLKNQMIKLITSMPRKIRATTQMTAVAAINWMDGSPRLSIITQVSAINKLIMHAVCSGCCRIHLLI